MNSRSKKYYENRKAQKGDKKGSVSDAGYNEQHHSIQSKNNPAPEKESDNPPKSNSKKNNTTF